MHRMGERGKSPENIEKLRIFVLMVDVDTKNQRS